MRPDSGIFGGHRHGAGLLVEGGVQGRDAGHFGLWGRYDVNQVIKQMKKGQARKKKPINKRAAMGRLSSKNEMYAGLDTDTAGALPTGRDKRAVQKAAGDESIGGKCRAAGAFHASWASSQRTYQKYCCTTDRSSREGVRRVSEKTTGRTAAERYRRRAGESTLSDDTAFRDGPPAFPACGHGKGLKGQLAARINKTSRHSDSQNAA